MVIKKLKIMKKKEIKLLTGSIDTSTALDEICGYLGVKRESIDDATVEARAVEILEENHQRLEVSIYRLAAFIAGARTVFSQTVAPDPDDKLCLTIHWDGAMEISGYDGKSDPDGVTLKFERDIYNDDDRLPDSDAERVAQELAMSHFIYPACDEYFEDAISRIELLGGEVADENSYVADGKHPHPFILIKL